jgi:membrane-associated phospholipid phosphatase
MACKDHCEEFEYALQGPQVEPAAGYWQYCARLCIVGIDELRALTDKKNDRHYFPPYPKDEHTLKEEIDELVELAHHRDDPCFLVNEKPCPDPLDVCEFKKGELPKGRCRRPISKLWNLCPYPLGAVLVNRFPGEQVIRTGRGLARAVESETPGLYHRHIADFLMRTRNWSPPRQSLVWAALDVAIASALQAAWYYKWLSEGREKSTHDCTARRERPIEYVRRTHYKEKEFSVLFDCPDELNPAYNLCPDAREQCRNPDAKDQPVSPGTPRHPAYPSGHSTYSAAASEILSFFFGKEEVPPFLCPHPRLKSYSGGTLKTEFDNLADNIGLGRMWAGVHWRSDHTAGQRLGRTVACLVLKQLANMGSIDDKGQFKAFNLCPPEPTMPCNQCDLDEKVDPCDETKKPPNRSQLCDEAHVIADHCGKKDFEPGDPCPPPPQPKKCEDHWATRIDAYRGPQQGGQS